MSTARLHVLAWAATIGLVWAGCSSDSGNVSGPEVGSDASDAAGDSAVDRADEDPTIDEPDSLADLDASPDRIGPADVPSEPDVNDSDGPVEDVSDVADATDGEAADMDAAGCAPKDAPNMTAPWLVVGVGLSEFAEIDNCDNVAIIEGIQGGYHVWGALRAGGFELEPSTFVNLTFTLHDGEQTVAMANYQDVLPESEGGYEYLAVTVLFIEGEDFFPTDFLGRRLLLRARVELDGVVDVMDEVFVIPNEVTF